ncbi:MULTISPECIES: polynucleotide adenylyltransferase PcnB [Corallococcus]|uniref:polynucleotide adenylyltransferase PcnB n=1 Tax=Corallococcus TaxID=83461 RepID=UPI00117D6458|nr:MULTISPECIES: polynucleotide adenylyltransferase PcnB [Corallococcus]NBD08554.1 polynucleotide adenylyltransferase PcnB [Corallococcus silvisoli]TSC33154.1 polynucleotide adenylyltransferase PcnB [Corallococcus sp. Z5C101001]
MSSPLDLTGQEERTATPASADSSERPSEHETPSRALEAPSEPSYSADAGDDDGFDDDDDTEDAGPAEPEVSDEIQRATEALKAAEAEDAQAAAEAGEEAEEPEAVILEPEPEPAANEPELQAPTTTRTGEPAEIDPDEMDPDALKVVLRLHQHGHQAYLVGGCVRDLLLGRKPKDFDVATSAHPGEVRAIFRNCRLIGRRFRLAHVYFKGGKIVEVSTFRANPTELEPAPGADEGQGGEDLLITHDNVFGTAQQDARRRDFTINGLFYDASEGRVIDYVRGRRDLDERFIRTIGDPEIRMREDPVRILRAVRFAAKLDLDIESRTYAAMEGAVEDLPRCAPARLLEETFRLIRGGVSAPALKLLAALDALKLLLPPVDEYLRVHGKEGEKTFYAFAQALDKRVSAGEVLDDAILLATLLVPISRAQPPAEESQDEGRASVSRVIEDLLAGFVEAARLPRRIAERCRMLLLMQRTLSGERRKKTGAFRRHPLFNEALAVFAMTVEATGEGREALDAWQAGEVPPPRAGANAGDSEGPRRKRRRRRRRRTGSGSGEGNGSGAERPASSGSDAGEG